MTDGPSTPSSSGSSPFGTPPGTPSAGADARFAALMRIALSASDDGRAARGAEHPVDPVLVAAHLAGATDDALVGEAAADPIVRELLADVVATSGAVADVAVAPAGANAAPPPLAAALRRRVEAMIDARAGIEPVARASGRVLRPARWTFARVAAAIVVAAVPLGAMAWWAHRTVAPTAALAVDGLARLARDGQRTDEGPRAAQVGDRFRAAAGERLAVQLPGGGQVVLGDEDTVRVACDPAGARGGGGPCDHAVLALDAGQALVAAGTGVGAAVLLLPGGDRLEVTAGAIHVALGTVVLGAGSFGSGTLGGGPFGTPGLAAGALAGASSADIAIRADGRLRWRAPDGRQAGEWSGPGRVLLRDGSARRDPSSEASSSLFRDLEFFGGARISARPDRRVSAPLWTVARSDGAARPSDSAGAPSHRFDLVAGQAARVTWTLDPVAASARSLKVLVRARPALSDPSGAPLPDTPFPRIVVAVEGVPGAEGVWLPAEEHDGRPAATRTVVLPWPAGAQAPSAGQAIVLSFRVERAAAAVWFEGASFSFADPRASAPERGE